MNTKKLPKKFPNHPKFYNIEVMRSALLLCIGPVSFLNGKT